MPILVKKLVKVLLAGSGTGGHMYPILAVGDYLNSIGSGNIVLEFMGVPGDFAGEFEKRFIKTHRIISSKVRRYFSLVSLFDGPKFILGLIQAYFKMFFVMPDVVFATGGAISYSVARAAGFYKIPVVIYESDSAPSLSTRASAKKARRIGLQFQEAVETLPKDKVFISGYPLRSRLRPGLYDSTSAKMRFGTDSQVPFLLVLGGSQGSVRINELVMDILAELTESVQVLHQTGQGNFKTVSQVSRLILNDVPEELRGRYTAQPYLQEDAMRAALQAADIVMCRAGAGTLAEIALFGKPAILIPLKESANDHQRENAYAYAKIGAAIVIEEQNIHPHILISEIRKLAQAPRQREEMGRAALTFAKPEATHVVAREILAQAGVQI